mgnify:CR=1 FL=1|tara:strand:+ start:498 stop:1763 length:1266 start_codon:yes stop_codon:yes gene_type:complete
MTILLKNQKLRDFSSLFFDSYLAVFGLVLLVVITLGGILAPFLAPQNPYDLTSISIGDGRLPPATKKFSEAPTQIIKLELNLPKDPAAPPKIKNLRSRNKTFLDGLDISIRRADVPQSYRLEFANHPNLRVEEISEVKIRRLPKGTKIEVGEKHKIKREWTLNFDDLQNLVFSVDDNSAAKQKFEVLFVGRQTDHLFTFWLGSDDQGRDMLSAILYGVRISLMVAGSSVLIACFFGSLAGLSAAYFGGAVGTVVMRLIDLKLSFPSILIALILLALLGKGVGNVVLAIVLAQWPLYARLVRGVALSESAKEYVEAAKSLGFSSSRIMFRHILPNCLAPLTVLATLQVANAISLEATLSFLGLGLPVTEPSLGSLIANGFEYLLSGHPWISILPGVALLLTVVSINLIGDHLRDVMNPRLQK